MRKFPLAANELIVFKLFKRFFSSKNVNQILIQCKQVVFSFSFCPLE